MDVRWVSLGRLDAALGLLHRGAGFKTGVEASHDKIAGLAADARGIRRIAPALQQLGEIHIGCRNRRRERDACRRRIGLTGGSRSEEHTSELQSLMRNSYAVFCLKKKKPSTSPLSK